MLFLVALSAIFSTVLGISSPGVYQITNPVDHSETPTWDTRNGLLYFVNMHAGEIYRYNPQNEQLSFIKLNGAIAPVIPSKQDPNLLIVGLNRSIVAVQWDVKSNKQIGEARVLSTVSRNFPTSQFNDGKADKNGRLWIGTMGNYGANGLQPNEGVLYEVTCKYLANPKPVIAPVNISNGAAFNKANDRYYYIDSPTLKVVEYKFDLVNGEISSPRTAFDVTKHKLITGSPDGLTIDDEDNLWVALYGGGAVVKVNPATGDLLQIVPIPALDVTSVMWGGPNLDVLFVTTSRIGLDAQTRREQPAAGAVFAVVGLKAKGLPMFGVDLIDSINDKKCGVFK